MAGARNPWEENYGSNDGQDSGAKPWEQAYQQPEPPKARTWGEAIKDTGAQLAEGVNTTLGAIPSVVAPQSKAAGFFRDNAQYWRDQQSDVLKDRIAASDQRIQEAGKDGVMSQIGTAASEYWNDPAQAARLVATNLPSMAATLGTGAAAGLAAKGVAAARGLDAANKAALAAKYGTTTTAATNAALNAGGARGEAFEDLQKTALAQGMTPEQAEQAGVSGSIMPGVVGGVAGAISGKIGLEKAILGQATTGAAMRKAAGAFGAELAGEQIEELAPKVATNYQVGRIDPGRTLTDDLGRTMVETAIGSGPGAVVAGGAAGMRTGELPSVDLGPVDPTTSPGAADPNAPVPPPVAGPTLALPAPERGVIQVAGDGTARTPAYQAPGYVGDVTDVEPRAVNPVREQVAAAAEQGGALSSAALTAIDTGLSDAMQPAPEQAPPQISLEEADARDQAAYEQFFASHDSDPVVSRYFENDDDIPDFDAASNASEEDFLRALGATDEDIQDAIATSSQSAIPQSSAASNAGHQAYEPAGPREGAGEGAASQTGQVNAGAIQQAAPDAPVPGVGGPVGADGAGSAATAVSGASGPGGAGAGAATGSGAGATEVGSARAGGRGDSNQALSAPTNLRDALVRVRQQKQEAANAQAAQAPVPAAAPVPGPAAAPAVEAAGAKPAGQRQLSADEQAAQDREEARAKELSLPPVLSARLQEAHKAHGRDVKRSVVERGIANEKANNTGTPKAKRERADRIARLEADLALFDEAAAMPPKKAAGPASIPATIGANSEPTPPQAIQASPQPAQAAAPAAAAGLTDGAPTANTGAQAAPATGAQGAAPAESAEQRTQRVAQAGEAWTRMPAAQREALAGIAAGLNPIQRKRVPSAAWADLNRTIQSNLADAMGGREEYGGNQAGTSAKSSPVATNTVAQEGNAEREGKAQSVETQAAPAVGAAPNSGVAAPAQEIIYNGTRIYPTKVKVGDEVKSMWAAESPDNQRRRAAGERAIGGDSLHDTLEQAQAAAKREAKRDAAQQAAKAEQDAADKARLDAEEARKAANRPKTLMEHRKDAVLSKQVLDSETGNVMTRREWVENKVADGLKTSITQEDKIKPMSRRQIFRADNLQQAEHDRKVKEAGKKDVYWLGDFEVTKIEYDYAQELKAQREAAQQAEAAPEPATKQGLNQPETPASQAPAATENVAISSNGQDEKAIRYELPPEKYAQQQGDESWMAAQSPSFKPTARQQLLMDAVAKALDDGAFYNRDVDEHVAKALGVTLEQRARNSRGVEGGDFGFDVYNASRAVQAQRSNAKSREFAKALNLKPGDVLGTLVFNDGKVTTGVKVNGLNDSGLVVTVTGKRGAATLNGEVGIDGLAAAMDRAKERGRRKDGYAEFVAGRAAVQPSPQDFIPAPASASPESGSSQGSSNARGQDASAPPTHPAAQPITRADVTAAQQQAAAIITERIDAMTAGEVNKIAKQFLPTMGKKATASKERNKAAMTDSAINLEAAAAEVGATLPADVRRVLQADMEGTAADGFVEQGDTPMFSRAQAKEIRNLVTLHNLTDENLRYADSMGGIPVPSIGITKVESPFGGFGNITLIAPKGMIDPKAGVPVYDRDAWTARFPTMNFKKVKAKMADAFYERMKPVRELMAGDDDGFISQLWEQLRNASVQSPEKITSIFTRYDAGRVMYAKEVLGKTIKVPMRNVRPATPVGHDAQLLAYWKKHGAALILAEREMSGAEFSNTPENKAFEEEVQAAIRRYADAAGAPESAKGFIEQMMPDGTMGAGTRDRLIRDFKTYGTKEVDRIKLGEAVNKAVKRDDPAYLRWVESLVKPLFEEPTITLRGREVAPTLDNIVDAMTVGATAGAEKSMTFSAGKVAAMLGKQFKSLDEIKAARDQVVSAQAETEGKKATDALLDGYRTHVSQFYGGKDWRGNIDTWAANDDSMEALAKAGKLPPSDASIRATLARMNFKGVDQRAVDMAREAIAALRNAATDYFEAKPQRAVTLDEFKGAVVPKGTSAETLAILEKHGIAVEVHNKTEGAREKAIQKLAKRLDRQSGDVLFARDSAAPPSDSNARNAATQLLVDGLKAKWTRSPEIIVARNMQDPQVPQAVRDYDAELKSQGSDGEARGFIYKGKVYLLSDELKGPQQIAEVLFHEVLGHYGLRGAFGESLTPILQQIGTMRRKEVAAKAREYGLFDKDALGGLDKKAASDAQIWAAMSPKDRLSAAEEVLAEMAQTQPTIGFVQRAIAAIRNWLRANVPGFKSLALTDNDIIQAYILPARGYVTSSRETGAQSLERAMRDAGFSRAPTGDQTQTDSFKRWFAGSRVVDAEGKPLVVYHGSSRDIESFAAGADEAGQSNGNRTGAWGSYFTPSAAEASIYAEIAGGDSPQNVVPVYLAIRNPYVMNRSEWGKHSQRTAKAATSAEGRADAKAVRAGIEALGHDGIVIRDRGFNDEWVAFRPEQIKSSTGNRGTFDPANPDIRFSRTTDAAKAVGDTLKSITVSNVKQRAGFKLTDYLGLGLQALGRRQIVDIYGDMLPLAEYNRLVQQMEADKNEGGAEADQLVTRWAKLDDESKLADLMHDATLAQIDPAKPYVGGDDKAKYAMLAGRFNALSQEAKQVYTDTRDAYQAHHAKVRGAIKERIERSEIKGERKAALLKQMDDEFFAAVKGVYFPLARFGQYAVTVKGPDGKVESVSRAETKAEAEALRNNLLSAFPRDKGFTVGRVMLSKDFISDRDAVGRGFMTELYQVLDKQDMDATQRAELEDTLGQLYLSSLPDLSWAKHGIHRKGTPGFSQDARRAFAQNMFHGARYLAKLRYSDLMQDELAAMQKHVDDWREAEDFDQNSAQRVVDEMNKRHESLMNPKSNPLSTALTSLGFVFHLGLSPASAMVNLSQTALVAYPIMGAKWGFGKASAALLKASAEAAKGKNDITGSLNADERAAYDEAVRAGTIDVTMAHDLAGIAQGEDAGVMWKLRPVMRWASFFFHHAERFNRQVTFVAAYRLAREAGADQKAAFEQATKATYDGHFDYGAANRPRVMQGNVAKVLLLFKQYGQNMVYTLARNAQQSIKGESPEVRAQARKALGGLLAMHAAAAGVLGLPMVTTLLAAASMIGGDDDEPWDAKVALQNMLADTFGQKPAEVLAHGLSRLTPWDISGRVGLDKLIFPDVQEGLEGQRLAESAMAAALGPVAGIGVNVLKGAQHMSEGRYALGLEAMMPAVLRGPVKAIRYANEGVQDKSGISILDEVGPAAVAGQALGFSPSQARNAQEGKSAVMAHDRALSERRQELLTRAARASMAKDAEALDDARKEIARFNEKNPGRRINPNHIMQSVRNRQKRIDQAEGGVYLPKNRRDAIQAGRFAFAESE